MSSLQDIFNSDFFDYVYIFRLGFIFDYGYVHLNEVYILSEHLLTEKEIAEKKRIITSTFNIPVIQIEKEKLNNGKDI